MSYDLIIMNTSQNSRNSGIGLPSVQMVSKGTQTDISSFDTPGKFTKAGKKWKGSLLIRYKLNSFEDKATDPLRKLKKTGRSFSM